MPVDPNVPLVCCARENSIKPGTLIPPGVKRLRCAGCGAALLASPSSLDLVKTSKAQPVCDECALRSAAEQGRRLLPCITEAGQREYREYRRMDQERN